MNKYISLAAGLLLAASLSSCRSINGSAGSSPTQAIDSYVVMRGDLRFVIRDEPVEHSIDISSANGRAKLKGITLQQAELLAIREAIMKSRCVKMVEPQFTNLTKGKKVLRITVYGFPADFKNKQE